MTNCCDACGTYLWRKPHVMLISSSPASVGDRLNLCEDCYITFQTVQRIVNQRTVKDDAGAATVCGQVD